MSDPTDIPSLTLKVLEKIQTELVGLRGDIRILNSRFDHFLSFVGNDVQDLKARMAAVEAKLADR